MPLHAKVFRVILYVLDNPGNRNFRNKKIRIFHARENLFLAQISEKQTCEQALHYVLLSITEFDFRLDQNQVWDWQNTCREMKRVDMKNRITNLEQNY